MPDGQFVYTVSELVDALHLAVICALYAQQVLGNLPYAPAMMLKFLVYGYAVGLMSSRCLTQKLEEALQAAAAALDIAEDAQFGVDLRGDVVPASLQQRESRRAAIGVAQAAAAARPDASGHPRSEARAQSQFNFTDPESRIMPTCQVGFQQCFNAQLVVDADNQVIVTGAFSPQARDQGQLPPRLDAVHTHYGLTTNRLMADAGYCNEHDLQELEPRGMLPMWRWAGRGTLRQGGVPGEPATPGMQTNLDTLQGQETYAQRKWRGGKRPSSGTNASWAFPNLGCAACTLYRADLVCPSLNFKRLHSLPRN